MKKLKRIVENCDSPSGRVFDLFIQLLILLSLITFSLETLPGLDPKISAWLLRIEIVTVVIFSIEYLLRLIVAENKLKFIFSFYGLIDLLAILPFYVARGLDLRSLRVFRLFRLIRIFKVMRFSKAVRRFQRAFQLIKAELWVFATAALFLFYVSGVGIYYFENEAQPEHFSSIFHSLWWAVVTLTTVGYGDVYPITIGGRIFTFLILMVGLGVVAVPTGLVSSALSQTYDEEEGAKER